MKMCGTKRRGRRRGIGHHFGVLQTAPLSYEVTESQLTSSGIYCLTCNYATNPESANFCQNCGASIYNCPISKMPFHFGDQFAQCPQCNTVFHKSHLDIALSGKNKCPYCQQTLAGIQIGEIGVHKIKI